MFTFVFWREKVIKASIVDYIEIMVDRIILDFVFFSLLHLTLKIPGRVTCFTRIFYRVPGIYSSPLTSFYLFLPKTVYFQFTADLSANNQCIAPNQVNFSNVNCIVLHGT